MTHGLENPQQSQLPAPVVRSERGTRTERGRVGKPKRPWYVAVIGMGVLVRGGREVIEGLARWKFGLLGVAATGLVAIAVVVGWRLLHRRRVAADGGGEVSQEGLIQQFEDSGLAGPAFEEDGTLLGSSVLIVNQRTKLLEVVTEYEIANCSGEPLGMIRQIGQNRWKRFFRLITAFDQFFTHCFEISDATDRVVLRLRRPAKLFRSSVHVYDADDTYVGVIRQQNVFGKIGFAMIDAHGNIHGSLKAEKWRAWDFHIYDALNEEAATVIKSWEGFARTLWSRADRYVVRVHRPLSGPMAKLTLACALSIDVALKQDARAFG